jgi:signal transduction histidine kinase/ActR/RegA family two-component response regulator
MTESAFLAGGGGVGALMRQHDWSQSPLDHPETWPQSLRSVVGLLLGSKFPMFVAWGPELGFLYNDSYAEILGAKHPRALGRRFYDIWSEIWPDISPLIDAAMAGEATFHENLPLTMNRNGRNEKTWFTFSYSPVRDESGRVAGMFCAVVETTRAFIHQRLLHESQARLSFLDALNKETARSSDADSILSITTRMVGEYMGVTSCAYADMDEDEYGFTIRGDWAAQSAKHIVGRYKLADFGKLAVSRLGAGLPLVINDNLKELEAHEAATFQNIGIGATICMPLIKEGRLTALMAVHHQNPHDWTTDELALIREVTERSWAHIERVRAEAEARRTLEILNNTGTKLASEFDLDKIVQTIVDAGVELTAARFGAFFYNVLDDRGESYMLYALSGADRSQFESFGMPRATAVFAPTFRGEGIVRSNDILADPRYGKNTPNKGMPKGHLPVRSYIAVPVTSRSGDVVGGLFFGHEAVGVFNERAERSLVGLAAQATIAFENARLFEDVQNANADLERRVVERTLELEQAHETLRQSQKMEAVGQLTGGIAHDFNNMLAVVMGSLELLGRRIGDGDAQAKRYIDAATDGARRAANLTQRLLAFSRQQPLKPEPLDANKLVVGMSDLLRHSLGVDVRLETVLGGGLWRTHADPNQLESAILNLAVNARDAMPQGGKLTIETQNTHLDSRYGAAHLGVAPGQYVLIAVTDTGTGMSADVVAKAFDPFFTTKGVGKGTGLGLSQVYGFVKQSKGHIKIYSEEAQGTTIKLYLPRYYGEGEISSPDYAAHMPLGGPQELVLVVEDESTVRQFTVDALITLGYRVLEADGASAALRILDTHPDIALLFTDVVMPEVNGAKLAEEALLRRPGLRVLFTTGYTRNAVVHNGVLDAAVHLIGKPFTLEQLATKIREVLDGPSSLPNV